MVREEEVTQLSVTLYLGETRLVESEVCEDCPLMDLAGRMERLAATSTRPATRICS